MSTKVKFLAIGDTATDVFIELMHTEASVSSDASKHPLLCMSYGTKIPFSNATIVNGVGNAANAAVAASKLGLHSIFMSNVGDDEVGEDILCSLQTHKVSTEFVKVNRNTSSNYHYVLWYGDDRTILIKHEKYNYIWPEIRDYQKPDWVYLSSIGENGTSIHTKLAHYIVQNPQTKFAFQPGTFQIREGFSKLKKLYEHADIFIANKEEYQQILHTQESSEKILIAKMHGIGPKTVLLTDGPKGAFASDGNDTFFMPPYPDIKPPLERTGAGDSYASTFCAQIAQGKSITDALAWAGVNSMNVVQHIGAQEGLLSSKEIEILLRKAPKHYQAKKI